MTADIARIGGRTVELGIAGTVLREYFDADQNRTSKHPYAYPAYDRFDAGSGPNELNDGDLLAPLLLNVQSSIAAFYALQHVRPRLESALAATPPNLTLTTAVFDGSLAARMAPFMEVLDEGVRGVRLTTLTKILHRKRPLFMPLHDANVRRCYLADDAKYPMHWERHRSVAEYWSRMATAISHDLTTQEPVWSHLGTCVPAGVSSLRLLDVVAWNLGRTSASG